MAATDLFLFNSMGRELQKFVPIHHNKVHLYTCGLTVYNYAHLGNLRAYVFTDTLRRVLQWKGYDVLHVMNITDVGHLVADADHGPDKMEAAARRQGKSVWELAAYYTEVFQGDLKLLNVMPPSVWCKATDHIQEMINFAQTLHDKGFTYLLEDGLYFDTSQVEDYGKLALLDLEGQQEGARVQRVAAKRNSTDFAVWRLSPKDQQRLMEWHSPWGTGAPGWHLECSCMSIKYLGTHFDIHTGGIDHRQVHHCNEIAQNQAYLDSGSNGSINFWLHNDFLVLKDEKMSKSTGDFIRLQSLVDAGIHPLVYRFFVLNANYGTPLQFSVEGLISARTGLSRLLKRIANLKESAEDKDWLPVLQNTHYSHGASFEGIIDHLRRPLSVEEQQWIEKYDTAISQNLNTPQAISLVFELTSTANLSADVTLRLLGICDIVLGLKLLELTPEDLNIRPKNSALTEADVEALIAKRNDARKSGDYALSDSIRDELASNGISLRDTKDGILWEWSPNSIL